MRKSIDLVCPDCRSGLKLVVADFIGSEIYTGQLQCQSCLQSYDILKGVPRFVSPDEDYCKNFGWQWIFFRRTQIDRFSGGTESAKRFFAETGWSKEELKGLRVLDAGCGAGRFTDIACQCGADVVAVDISEAVYACSKTVENQGYNVDIIQASIYKLPFQYETFDRIFSLGVLHHCPDPQEAIRILTLFLKPGGKLALWVYEKQWRRFFSLRHYLRFLTRPLSPKANFRLSFVLAVIFFPVTLLASLLPGIGRVFLYIVPITARHYWGSFSISQQFEWTLLDTFDYYAAKYVICQNAREIIATLKSTGMINIRCNRARRLSIVAEKAANQMRVQGAE